MVDTWQSRELPILNAIPGLEETTTRAVSMDALAMATAHEVDYDSLQRGLKALHDGGYVTGQRINRDASHPIIHIEGIGLTAPARRAIGQWPASVSQAFIVVLDRAIEREDDEGERSKLERLREIAGKVSQETLTRVLTDVVRSAPDIIDKVTWGLARRYRLD